MHPLICDNKGRWRAAQIGAYPADLCIAHVANINEFLKVENRLSVLARALGDRKLDAFRIAFVGFEGPERSPVLQGILVSLDLNPTSSLHDQLLPAYARPMRTVLEHDFGLPLSDVYLFRTNADTFTLYLCPLLLIEG